MRVATLGRTWLEDGEQTNIDLTPRERALVAALAFSGGTARLAQLFEAIWNDDIPSSGEQVLRNAVSQLRRKIGEERLRTVAGGYELVFDRHDVREFEMAIERARRTIGDDPAAALTVLDTALAEWGGEPYESLAASSAIVAERRRLSLLRSLAQDEQSLAQLWIDPALALTRLHSLVADEPDQQRRWSLLAAAEFLTGRQADALRTLARGREHLRDSFGLDPGPELIRLEQAILNHDEISALSVLGLPSRPTKAPNTAQTTDVQTDDVPTGTEAEVHPGADVADRANGADRTETFDNPPTLSDDVVASKPSRAEVPDERAIRRRRFGRVRSTITAALVLAVLGVGVAVIRSNGSESTPVTFRIGIVEPQAIDPAIVNSNAGAFITNLLFVSLTTLDTKTNELKPGVAERWDRNDDCTSWTFHLRPNRFANGEAVDAEAFVRAYTRLAKKSANSEVAGFLESIVGFNAINSGATNEFTGLEIIDSQTLRIRTAEDCDFDRETSLSEFSPVPTVAGDARNASFNQRPIGNGPYRLAAPWEKGRPITLVRNPKYDLGSAPAIERIEVHFETPEQSFVGFLRGERDYARVPLRYFGDADRRYGKTDKLFAETKATLDYLYVSVNRPPYNNVGVRRAISMAIDRERLVAGSLGGIGRPADSVIPPSFGAFYRKGSCAYCRHDPTAAKALARVSGLAEGSVIPLEYTAGERNQAWVSAVADDIESTLGVRVELRPVAFEENSNKGKPGATGLFQHTWEADYPTPTDFLARIFGTGSFGNFFGYSNPRFDDEISSAIRQPDTSRVREFAKAEDLVLDDLPIIPIWNKTLLQVANTDRFIGVHTNFFDYPVLAEVSVAANR